MIALKQLLNVQPIMMLLLTFSIFIPNQLSRMDLVLQIVGTVKLQQHHIFIQLLVPILEPWLLDHLTRLPFSFG